MSSGARRMLADVQRLFVLGPGRRAPTMVPASGRPDDPRAPSRRARLVGIVAAVVVPIAFAWALVPARDALEQSTSLLMVLPVLCLAFVGGARLGIVAAVVGAIAFDVFHTAPYFLPAINQSADVVEMIVLLVVGVITGLVASSAQRARAGASVRRRELDAITSFIESIRLNDPEHVIEQGRSSIAEVLLARSCAWSPGYRGTAAPTLQLSGAIVANNVLFVHDLDGRRLPAQIEIPVGNPPNEHGRFIVANSGAEVSVEERRTAAAIASALGRLLGRRAA